MKVDLAIWAKNGSFFLPRGLKRIDETIPHDEIQQKILVDDHSTDDTVKIAREFNWQVYENASGYIAGGINVALQHITSDFFVSIEQDLVLSRDWWRMIPPHMEDPKVAVAQGIRLPTDKLLRTFDELSAHAYNAFSLDNNVWRTSIIKSLWTYPFRERISVDRTLFHDIAAAGYRWIIDRRVISEHIKTSVLREIDHAYKLNLLSTSRQLTDNATLAHMMRLLLTSPIRGTQVALDRKLPEMFVIYPYMRLWALKTFLHRRAALRCIQLEPKEWSEYIEKVRRSSVYPSFLREESR